MIRRKDELVFEQVPNLRGGNGIVKFEHILKKGSEEFFGKGRVFSKIILNKGESIGEHVHEKEMEVFYVEYGTATYDDNGNAVKLYKGDVSICMPGEKHSLSNEQDEQLCVIALILFE